MGLSDLSSHKESFSILQKQAGFYRIRFALLAGDIDASTVRQVGEIATRYGCGELRSTGRQELEIPFVGEGDLQTVLFELEHLGLRARSTIQHPNVVACPGADQCSVAYVPTKKICSDLDVFLRNAEKDRGLPPAFRIAISGCPNECSQTGVNDIGFVGTAGAYGGRRVLGFELVVGGSIHGQGRLAERIAFISPEDVIPTFRDLLDIYEECASPSVHFNDFYFEMGAEELSRLLLEKLRKRISFFQI